MLRGDRGTSGCDLVESIVEGGVTHAGHHVIGEGDGRSRASGHAVDEDVAVRVDVGADEAGDAREVVDESDIAVGDSDTETGTTLDAEVVDGFRDTIEFDDGDDIVHVVEDSVIDEGTDAADPDARLDLIGGVLGVAGHN